MKVAIIGSGIVGLFTAYYLMKEGVNVTLFDPADPGSYSIHAAGLIEPTRFDRINTTEMIAKMLKYKLLGTTEIKNVNKFWLKELLVNLNKEPPQEVWDVMREMAKFSLDAYKNFAEERNDFDYRADGLYEIYLNINDLEKGLREEKKNPFNPRYEVKEIEGFAGSIYFPELSRISTEKFISRMMKELKGILFKRIAIDSLKIKEIKDFDFIVLTTGFWTTKLINIPITPFKGYGYRVKGDPKLNYAAVIQEEGVAISPLSNCVKITGGFDADSSYDSSRAEIFLKKASKLIDIEYIEEMNMGFRPCSPDGFPIIGKKENIVISTGACRLGWSYGPAMGKYASDLVIGKSKDYGFLSKYVNSL
ncbi:MULTISPECIES: FAD-dependent oxidoreductase [Acidianus]|uniref:FAD-dependent oxidoreductase n=1 Tax=Acidianus TaxID=12914 RepID=UPI00064F21AD|nr:MULTISPECIES: FAD-dependent oxidoreductase [Acidianus]NON63577.1 FAD-binding oxidoreductase [Acidianus sp. RZ1]